MTEQYISFDTAKLAKEKGFDIPINIIKGICYYNHRGVLNGDSRDEIKQILFKRKNPDFVEDESIKNIAAPTQSLLQKWLREVHHLVINVKHITHNQKYGFFVTSKYNELNEGYVIPYDFKGFETWELALEEGLKQTLQLIKNENTLGN